MGAVCRYSLGRLITLKTGNGFPTGTLAINTSGALMLSLLLHGAVRWSSLEPHLQLALTAGFLGAYTTFSTFAYEASQIFQEGEYLSATGYLLATAVLGLVAAWAGKIFLSIL